MSFNKKFLPEKNELIEYLEKRGSEAFYWMWIRSIDAFIGPTESIEFIRIFAKKYHDEDQEFTRVS